MLFLGLKHELKADKAPFSVPIVYLY